MFPFWSAQTSRAIWRIGSSSLCTASVKPKRKPPGYWKQTENQKSFLEDLFEELNLPVGDDHADWQNLTPALVRKKGGTSLLGHYTSFKHALQTLFPDVNWDTRYPDDPTPSTSSDGSGNPLRPPEGAKSKKKKAPGKDLMLSQVWNDDIDPTGYWISEKYDGIRAFWSGKELFSRYGRPLSAPGWFLNQLPAGVPLDGELWAGYEQFGHLIRVLKTNASDDWRSCKMMVFDYPDDSLPFEARKDKLKETVTPNEYLELVPYVKCQSVVHLKEELQKVVDRGGEGLMIRKPEAGYLAGRSYNMLKVKLQQDAEVKMVRPASKCMGYDTMLPNDVMITIRCTYTDFKHPPPAGTILQVKHFGEWKNSGKLKNPYFWRIRNDGVSWEELVERYNIDRGLDPSVNPDINSKE